MYGLIGAVGFRAICIAIGTTLIKFWWLKLFGALYLAKLAIGHFTSKDLNEDGIDDNYQDTMLHRFLGKFGIKLSLFWTTVISIELMDLTFSVDSILASLAVSDKFIILLIGGFLGILMMRGVAQFFIKLVERVPILENTAYILIGIIAIKMFITTIGDLGELMVKLGHYLAGVGNIEMSSLIFLGILVAVFLGTFVVNFFMKRKEKSVEVKEA
jgi:YkoY family integral membrane protein